MPGLLVQKENCEAFVGKGLCTICNSCLTSPLERRRASISLNGVFFALRIEYNMGGGSRQFDPR